MTHLGDDIGDDTQAPTIGQPAPDWPPLSLKVRLDRSSLPVGTEPSLMKCHISVSHPDRETRSASASTHLCLVFDCSTSMSGRRIRVAADSAKAIVDAIDERHRVSLIAFQSKARVLVDNQHATMLNKLSLKSQIDRLHDVVGGSTDTAAGIAEGMRVIERAAEQQPNAANIMVLLSDGAANSVDAANRRAAAAAATGTQLYAVGIGMSYDAQQLMDLVRPSNGAVFGAEDLEETKNVFCDLIERIDNFGATGARIEVELGQDVQPGECTKTQPEKAFLGPMRPNSDGRIGLQVGNLEIDKEYGFLLDATVPACQTPGEQSVARVYLTYDVPSHGLTEQCVEASVSVTRTQAAATENTTDAAARINSDSIQRACLDADIARKASELPKLVHASDAAALVSHLEQLRDSCDQAGDEHGRDLFGLALEEAKLDGRLSNARLNACLVASTANRKDAGELDDPTEESVQDVPAAVVADPVDEGTPLAVATNSQVQDEDEDDHEVDISDVIAIDVEDEEDEEAFDGPADTLYALALVDPGDAPIAVVRELRAATGMQLRAASRFVQGRSQPGEHSWPLETANALRDRLQHVGASVRVVPQSTPNDTNPAHISQVISNP